MLCRFIFKNFKSYRDETIFDMQAANIEEYSDSLISSSCDRFSSLLPVSVIYGPNAGGKSNALQALIYLISRILMPIRASTDYRNPFSMLLNKYEPFLLDTISKNSPTEFEIFFRTNAAQYHYKLALLQNTIISESLSYIKFPCQRRRSVLLFDRIENEIELGSALKKANTKLISETIPYVSFLAINYNFPEIKDIIDWFKACYIVDYAVSGKDHRLSPLLDHSALKPAILELLSKMDIPLSDYEIIQEDTSDGGKTHRVITTHIIDGHPYQLDLRDESEGTIKIFSMLPAVLFSLSDGGRFIVDELDAKLHPQLLRFLIKLYTNPEINHKHAQLIFTCHDLSVMKNDLLRRDEIWFADRNEDSVSELWSLYDLRDERGERIKNTAAYDKQYLAGRYGADPYLQRISDWRIPDAEET